MEIIYYLTIYNLHETLSLDFKLWIHKFKKQKIVNRKFVNRKYLNL